MQVFLVAANADSVSLLLNGRIGRDLLCLRGVAVVIHLDDAVDMNLVGRATRERNVARASADREVELAAERQVAVECGGGWFGDTSVEKQRVPEIVEHSKQLTI